MKVIDFFNQEYRPLRLSRSADNTIGQYEGIFRFFGRFLSRDPILADLNDHMVTSFLTWYGTNRAIASLRKFQTKLLSLWKFAIECGIQLKRPQIRPVKVPYQVPVAWLPDELAKLLQSADKMSCSVAGIDGFIWWPAFIRVLIDTGARRAAALSIRIADTDLEKATILIRAEHQKVPIDQLFYLGEQTVEILRKLVKRIEVVTNYFRDNPKLLKRTTHGFVGKTTLANTFLEGDRLLFPWPYSSSCLYYHYHRLLQRAGLPWGSKYGFHCLRRTTASMIASKLGATAASEALGHSTYGMTRCYLDPRYTSQLRPDKFLPELPPSRPEAA